METEKVCVNLSAGELGKLDLLVAKGIYVNRTDVVRAALRREFDLQDWDAVTNRELGNGEQSKAYGAFGIGYFNLRAQDMEAAIANGDKVEVFCAGIVVIDDDVTPDLADEAIGSMRVLGSLRGPKPVLERLASRTKRGRSS